MLSYKEAGVDIDAGEELVRRIKTFAPAIGGFAGGFPLDEDNLLVASTDGVGTKLSIAIALDQLENIGQDLVAMCVNDLIAVGARPLFFLDYYATGRLDVERAEKVVRGINQGCTLAGCPLLGGETAEMPGFYPEGRFDLAGFAVGIVRKEKWLDGKAIQEGDILVGLPSSGLHSNGYSLVRKILEKKNIPLSLPFEGKSLGETLLVPTRIYTEVLALLESFPIKGAAHLTGGGFDNIARILPPGLRTRLGSWKSPSIFEFLQREGKLSDEEMKRTFNLGIGMALVLAPEGAEKLLEQHPGAIAFGEIAKR
ncbi:MAG TPA: phosphoribosylformylglycinamidine cyclo-ligase [Chroococcales cyanobacterium]|jgi:phosphoribosylformylglycinamidine cyclo-ligase